MTSVAGTTARPTTSAAWRTTLGVLTTLSMVVCCHAATPSAVEVRSEPVQVSRHTYSKRNPPEQLRQLTADELGVCLTQFGCDLRVRTQWTVTGNQVSSARLTHAIVGTRISIDLWTVEGSGAAVAAHEETHRLISEHYYARAGDVARRLAERLIGRDVTVSGAGKAAKPDVESLERELVAAFMWQTSSRCEYAQERFDAITDHSRKQVSNAAAMRQALTEEAAHWELVKNQRPPEKADVRVSSQRVR